MNKAIYVTLSTDPEIEVVQLRDLDLGRRCFACNCNAPIVTTEEGRNDRAVRLGREFFEFMRSTATGYFFDGFMGAVILFLKARPAYKGK